MSSHRLQLTETRQHPRLTLPAMYTLLRVRPVGQDRFTRTGHIYDISLSGMRFELDEPVSPGTHLEVRVMLPGTEHVTFEARGLVVRIHDDEPMAGPVRMAMQFEGFSHPGDEQRLRRFLGGRLARSAA